MPFSANWVAISSVGAGSGSTDARIDAVGLPLFPLRRRGQWCREWLSGSEQLFDPFGESIFVERTEMGVERAVVVDEDERRLTADAVELPDIAINVGGVGKSVDAGVGDKGLDLLDGVATGDTDDLSPALELMLHGRDRTRFTATRCSPRRPEPQDDVVTFEIVCVDETAPDGVLNEVVGPLGVDRVRCTAFDVGEVIGGTSHGEQGDDSRQTREQDPGAVREHE